MRWLSLYVLLLSGCTVPGLSELERVAPGACDSQHACAPGYSCIEGSCQANADLSCEPGTKWRCGRNTGECQVGEATCQANGRLGPCEGEVASVAEVCNGKDDNCDGTTDEEAVTSPCGLQKGVCAGKARACSGGTMEATCTAASYGADYQPSETRCDNLDNDCDGETDEALTQPCVKQQGVCAGAVQTCATGAYAACSDEVYRAGNSAYQAFEQSCDGQDNDCDGQVDTWAPLNLSRTTPAGGVPDTMRSRNAAAIAVPQDIAGQPTALLTLYEEENRILARTFYPDGSAGEAKVPSSSVPVAFAVTEPALASNGQTHVGAWIEEFRPPNSPPTYRVVVARLGSNGVSVVAPDRAVIPVFDRGHPARIALAVGRDSAIVVVEQAQGSGSPGLWAVTLPLVFPPESGTLRTHQLTTDTTASRPSVFPPRSSAESFFVAYESSAGIRVTSVKEDGTVRALAGLDLPGASQPQVSSTPAFGNQQDYTVYFVPPSRESIAAARCTRNTTSTSCGAPEELLSRPLTGTGVEGLRLASRPTSPGEPLLATWVSDGKVKAFRLTGAPTEASLLQAHSAGRGFRPLPVVLEAGSTGGGKGAVLFDTEGNTEGGLARDEIFLVPVCLP
jgi:hypothetical protein